MDLLPLKSLNQYDSKFTYWFHNEITLIILESFVRACYDTKLLELLQSAKHVIRNLIFISY